jgi:hypothetical protein
VDDLDTPGIVLRELTTNAVVHRDLNVFGSQVRIQVFPRYVEWSSPGGLPANITIETLLTAQFSRNPSLARFLFHAGYIEKFGMGLDVVSDALRQAKLGSPEFHDDGHSFRVRVYRGVERSAEGVTRDGRVEAILALFAERAAWRQREMLDRLRIPRSTLQWAVRQAWSTSPVASQVSNRMLASAVVASRCPSALAATSNWFRTPTMTTTPVPPIASQCRDLFCRRRGHRAYAADRARYNSRIPDY